MVFKKTWGLVFGRGLADQLPGDQVRNTVIQTAPASVDKEAGCRVANEVATLCIRFKQLRDQANQTLAPWAAKRGVILLSFGVCKV